ncbi:hypothetical protein APICC_01606 [Apis cerana cerana]|uniref:Uncharacterized protein n=1 Tax=Apis cerana cerana TaxID=94128 RepID=A0A2A3E253_APICC|nr:hypothetical protein APICC_01606 [Apis cerana cerana]
MPRKSVNEMVAKHDDKTRALIETVSLYSPLRRSSRIKQNLKKNDSSPELSLNDVSNTQIPRQQITTVDNTISIKNQRKLRSRTNTISSDIEVLETDISTTTKKTRNNPSNNNKIIDSRRSKYFVKDESETNSPSVKNTHNIRASSMEPETISDELTEKQNNELRKTSIKTKRQSLLIPSEIIVTEEKEELMKFSLNRTLPDINENIQSDSKSSFKSSIQKNEPLPFPTNKCDRSNNSICEEHLNNIDTSVDFVEEVLNRKKQPEKESVQNESNDSIMLIKQCTNELKSEKKYPENETINKKYQEKFEVDDNSNTNLFQDISVIEWKKKNNETDKNSLNLSSENIKNEKECDLVLVDKDAWLSAEKLKKNKKKIFDYDSDDTIVLKVQRDSMKEENDTDILMDMSEDKCKLNNSTSKSSTSNKQQTMKDKNKEKKEVKSNMEETEEDVKLQNIGISDRKSLRDKTRKKLKKNYSTTANILFDSEKSKNISDSDDTQKKFMNIPKFLFAETSDSENNDSESNNSIDSDIQKEYNFHGKNISKFSDDDIVGDECRASEMESSDPDDNGSDMADFIVDNDEVEEEEEESESEEEENEEIENEEKKNKESENEEKEAEEIEIEEKEYEKSENEENEDEEIEIEEKEDEESEEKENEEIENDVDTPKINLSDKEKFNIKNYDVQKNLSLDEEKSKDITLKKKSKKLKNNESLAHRSLPSELIEFVTETNLSRPMSSKVLGLNKTTLVLGSDTPTTRYLKKDKLNENTMFEELTNTINSSKKNDQIEKENEDDNEKNKKISKVNDSLEKKSFNIVDNMLKNDQKMQKKRKQSIVKKITDPILFENDFQLNKHNTEILKKTEHFVPFCNTNDNETKEVDKTKKKKKKTHDIDIKKNIFNIETKSESLNEKICNEIKKKKERENTTDYVSNLTNINNINIKGEKETHDINVQMKEKIIIEDIIENKSKNLDEEIHNEVNKKKKKNILENISDSSNINKENNIIKKKEQVLDILPKNNILNVQLSKKNKKKKIHDTDIQIKEEIFKDIVETKSKNLDKEIRKKKKEIRIENIPNLSNIDKDINIVNEKEEISYILSNKNVLNEQLFKKNKKKKNVIDVQMKKENITEKNLENHDKKVHNEEKRKKKEENTIKDSSNLTNSIIEKTEVMKHKKGSDGLSNNNISNELLSKEKKRKQKLLKEVVLQDKEELLEKISQKKQKLLKNTSISNTTQKRKQSETYESKPKKRKIFVEQDFSLPSNSGSTTDFDVIDIQKIRNKKNISFRDRMLARNSRQSVSLYMKYLKKQKMKSSVNNFMFH